MIIRINEADLAAESHSHKPNIHREVRHTTYTDTVRLLDSCAYTGAHADVVSATRVVRGCACHIIKIATVSASIQLGHAQRAH
jgi:hypothetical protein